MASVPDVKTKVIDLLRNDYNHVDLKPHKTSTFLSVYLKFHFMACPLVAHLGRQVSVTIFRSVLLPSLQ